MSFFRRGSRPKYNNSKRYEDGFTFDSDVEMQYYRVLKHRQEKGEIFGLTLKPKFPLIVNGVKINERAFRPDFGYWTVDPTSIATAFGLDNMEAFRDSWHPERYRYVINNIVIADTKGYLDPSDPATRIFNTNKRLVLALYGIDIQIIQSTEAAHRQAQRKQRKVSERTLLRNAMKGLTE